MAGWRGRRHNGDGYDKVEPDQAFSQRAAYREVGTNTSKVKSHEIMLSTSFKKLQSTFNYRTLPECRANYADTMDMV